MSKCLDSKKRSSHEFLLLLLLLLLLWLWLWLFCDEVESDADEVDDDDDDDCWWLYWLDVTTAAAAAAGGDVSIVADDDAIEELAAAVISCGCGCIINVLTGLSPLIIVQSINHRRQRLIARVKVPLSLSLSFLTFDDLGFVLSSFSNLIVSKFNTKFWFLNLVLCYFSSISFLISSSNW